MANIESIDISAIWANENLEKSFDEPKTNIFRNTVGGNVWYNDENHLFLIHAIGYYQFGRDKFYRKLDAFLLALEVQYKIFRNVTITLGGDYISGTKNSTSQNNNNTFNRLYGANHVFNGSMEYWVTPPKQGLIDLCGNIDIISIQEIKINCSFHTFATVYKLSNSDNQNIGSEIDIFIDYEILHYLNAQAGYSIYFKNMRTSIIKNQIDVDTHLPQWVYVMFSFNLEVFSKKY